jgi:hypothetical protein
LKQQVFFVFFFVFCFVFASDVECTNQPPSAPTSLYSPLLAAAAFKPLSCLSLRGGVGEEG